MNFKIAILERVAKWFIDGDLLEFVKNMVELINDEEMSGEEKKQEVFSKAKTFFVGVGSTAVYFAIEIAVIVLKMKIGKADEI